MVSYEETMVGGPWHGELHTLTSTETAAGHFAPGEDVVNEAGEYVRDPSASHMWIWQSADPAEQGNPAQFEPSTAKTENGLLTWLKRRWSL